MELKFVLESLLFASAKPLSVSELREVLAKAAAEEEAPAEARDFKKVPTETVEAALRELAGEHDSAARSYRLVCVAGAWQFVTQPEVGPWLKTLVGVKNRPSRLSQPGLETLAVIAYRQPVTRAEIEQIRGVAVDGVIATLKERGLIAEAGRAEVIGRPMQYVTTTAFLEYFGLASLEALPAADELRRIPVERPEALVTAENVPATDASQIPLNLGTLATPAVLPEPEPEPVPVSNPTPTS
ncbi:MAG TPA: SMC-Scp complex subunit ScpB [Verrucomicrobiota bacterium]|nr:SMC-Scp complex subunit ScpB [Verrucomicrobiota bacterium]